MYILQNIFRLSNDYDFNFIITFDSMKPKSNYYIRFSWTVILYPLLFLLGIWMVYWCEINYAFSLNEYGVFPRSTSGLIGVLVSPFVHSGLEHLYHNSAPLVVLSAALFYFYQPISWKVFIFGYLGSGLMLWFIGRPAYHIGASGIIYFLFGFLFFKGLISRYFRLIALSLAVVFLYGSLVWGIFPTQDNVSWEGHLAGLFVGLILALVYKDFSISSEYDKYKQPVIKDSPDDPFLAQFDENGNFIDAKDLENDSFTITSSHHQELDVTYEIKRKTD